MENNQLELQYEEKRLESTISLAKKQLEEAKLKNEQTKLDIIEAKKELRENTVHSISNLWSSDDFEALVELSQYENPVLSKIEDFDEVTRRIEILEKIIDLPYFARIDFKFDGEDQFEQIYIGRSSLKKDNSFEMDVYDWRSPIAGVFYRFVLGPAFYDAPGGRIDGEVNLKRQYEIKKGTLEYFFDADVQIVDEFLRKLLSGNTSSKMKTIVETIQKEQDIVIRDMENGLMMVQGVAGSGKTSIALHRAAYLMYQGLSSKLSANNILIVSPNSLFEQYISNVLPELGEKNVVSVVFEEMLSKILHRRQIQSRNRFLENLINSPGYRDIIKSSIEFKTSGRFVAMLNRFIEDIPHNWIAFEDVCFHGHCILRGEKLKEKIIGGSKETPLGMKLRQLEDFIFEAVSGTRKKRLNKAETIQIKEQIRTFTRLNIEVLYRRLFDDKEYLVSLADGALLPDNLEEIMEFTRENLDSRFLSYEDAAVLAYLTIKINATNKYRDIKQVVIDEAQDYYPLHYEIFNLLFKNSKFTVLGDINQTLEKKEDLTLYEQIRKILNKKQSSLVTMDKSFRCTSEILDYSTKFIDQSLEVKSFNRSGDQPEVYPAGSQAEFEDMLIREIETCRDQGYQSIGLICKTEKNARALFELLKDRIDIQLVKNESTTDLQGVFIIPVYMSKGLEFDAVLVCDADHENYYSEDDKKLLYIACTRALHRLNLFCQGTASPLLS